MSYLPVFALLACAAITSAADISGRWTGEVDTPVGVQKYVLTLKADGESLSGKAEVESERGSRSVDLTRGAVKGSTVTFVEAVRIPVREFEIQYTGTLDGDTIQFTRQVGDFGTDQMTVKRMASAPAAPPKPAAAKGTGGFGGPIVLGPDDKPMFPDPPAGFDRARSGIPQGRLEMIEYDSKTVGTRRKMQVYTPPGYTPKKKYPVLYLLHGIGGDETEWQRFVSPDVMLDNLIADKKVVPMIVVMPNGRAQANDRAEGNVFQSAPAFARFERDLLDDVIPAIESKYSVAADREHRAVAGLSMGGGQSLNFGLAHLDTFAWVGAFSPAPNTKAPADLVPNPQAAAKKLNLLYLSCGNKDGLIRISQNVHAHLKEKGVPHIWHVDGNAHDMPEWKAALYHFSQRVFADKPYAVR